MELIVPNWKVPGNIKAFTTTRLGGISDGVYKGLNLGLHVEDDPIVVKKNRQILHEKAMLPSNQVWLNQTHSDLVVELKQPTTKVIDADGALTSSSNVVCTVMTADCLPVLLTDIEGTMVAAVHAGWRGLADGILENAVKEFTKPVIAWLGPAIGAGAFEVGQDVFDIFVSHSSQAEKAFQSKSNGKYLADMNMLATQRLNDVGVESIYRSNMCTFEDSEKFYSYRRDGVTGRQATFIWID
ncbi:peptidoglycan editing factor PgeF [Vibrio sp. VB16]|uniref:peptidoglycan editing factor PgeF n=1 Tax=Vibrio sp. VB16 TaxID=2785746 RepID=UPI00189FD416|nr:peptidoglycan editing factor PgeF [Vibrio sp. VB16]UGA55283.1 peptidoglycan editing factor PgeF [Vibrio sp. VB16]